MLSEKTFFGFKIEPGFRLVFGRVRLIVRVRIAAQLFGVGHAVVRDHRTPHRFQLIVGGDAEILEKGV